MDLIRKIPKKFTKKFGNKVINRQYFRRKTGLKASRASRAKTHQKQKQILANLYIFPCFQRLHTHHTSFKDALV